MNLAPDYQGKVYGSKPVLLVYTFFYGPVASNRGNRYVTLLALILWRHGLPHAEVNSTE